MDGSLLLLDWISRRMWVMFLKRSDILLRVSDLMERTKVKGDFVEV